MSGAERGRDLYCDGRFKELAMTRSLLSSGYEYCQVKPKNSISSQPKVTNKAHVASQSTFAVSLASTDRCTVLHHVTAKGGHNGRRMSIVECQLLFFGYR